LHGTVSLDVFGIKVHAGVLATSVSAVDIRAGTYAGHVGALLINDLYHMCSTVSNGPYYYYNHFTALCILSRTTRVSWYQKGKTKTNLDFLEQETVNGSGISWQICSSPQTNNHASTPPLRFYRPDVLPSAQPTASKAVMVQTVSHIATNECPIV